MRWPQWIVVLLVTGVIAAGCDRAAEPAVEVPDAQPEVTADDARGTPVLTAPPRGREDLADEMVDRPWLAPGREIEVGGVRYRADDLTMTFYEGDLVRHTRYDGVALYRPIWSDPADPDHLFVRLSEWLWRPLQRID